MIRPAEFIHPLQIPTPASPAQVVADLYFWVATGY